MSAPSGATPVGPSLPPGQGPFPPPPSGEVQGDVAGAAAGEELRRARRGSVVVLLFANCAAGSSVDEVQVWSCGLQVIFVCVTQRSTLAWSVQLLCCSLCAGGDKHGALTPEQQLQALMQRLGLDPDELMAAAAAAAGEELPPGVGPDPPDNHKTAGAQAAGIAAAAAGYGDYYYDPYYGWVPYPADHPAAGAGASSGHNNGASAAAQQQQSPEPPPPGCEEEWEAAAAEAAAASAYANAYSGYGGYDSYGGYAGYDSYGGYGDAAFDPLAHMTEEEYAAYIGDSGPAVDETAAAAAAAEGGKGDGEKRERKRPAVVQVISLDPMELER